MQEFIIHSPDFEAAKFWVGNMGKTATHAVVYAQLYTPGGQCHGLHPFVVQVGAGFIPEVGRSGHFQRCFYHSWGQGCFWHFRVQTPGAYRSTSWSAQDTHPPAPGRMISPICEVLLLRNTKSKLILGRPSILLDANAQALAAGLRGSRSSEMKSDSGFHGAPSQVTNRALAVGGAFPTAQGGCSVHRPGAPKFTQDLCAWVDWILNETRLPPSPNPF